VNGLTCLAFLLLFAALLAAMAITGPDTPPPTDHEEVPW
jgi:hypothetical protein